jgi:hypothetical protein
MRLTATRLRVLLSYRPRTGEFIWLIDRRGRFARSGTIAGTVTSKGYRQICIDGKLYGAGPLAVLWMTGRWPRRLVDHRNGIKGDNRWTNLRQANHSQNGANSADRPSAAPLKGVTPDRGKYAARIRVNYRTINLGRFETPRAAHAAYVTAARQHFGEYARRQ